MTSHNDPDDFDIAKAIASQIKELSPERKERIFRWVAESIGLAALAPRQASGAPAHSAPAIASTGAPAVSGATNIKSFIASKEPKGDAQFAVAAAYFYRFEAPAADQRETINSRILQEAARLAARARFSNPLTTLNNAKRSGYLDSVSPGEFAINSVGENLVAMTLPGSTQNPNGARRVVNKKKMKAAKKKR